MNPRDPRIARLTASLLALAACGDADAGDPPEDGGTDASVAGPAIVEYRLQATIEAGVEMELCKFLLAPEEGMWINRDEIAYTPGSHHVLLFGTMYEEVPTTNIRGQTVDTSDFFPCDDGTGDWSLGGLIAGTQNANGASSLAYPPGVATFVPGGAVLLVNAHYLNATAQTLEPEIIIELHTIPEDDVVERGGFIFWYDLFIRVEAGQTGTARMRCPIHEDITLTTAQSHMHARGVHFVAELVRPDGTTETLYETDEWEEVPTRHWPEGLPVEKGSVIDFRCDYQNDSPETIAPRARDSPCTSQA